MRAPKKVIAAMALATLIGGTVGQAFADETDFVNSAGTINGLPMQTSKVEKNVDSAEGDIKITGTFNKHISAFPDHDQEGRYLQVSMPISLSYFYDVDTGEINSSEGKIRNESVYVRQNEENNGLIKSNQPVNMTLVGMDEVSDSKVMYVNNVNEGGSDKVKLPFEVVITRNGGDVTTVSLADLVNDQVVDKSVRIEAGTSVDFKIGKINSQKVVNGDKLDNGYKLSNNIRLQFEYDGE